ncbi:hypothetical protein BO99DRAFT_91760 [Aspergillus violaceofuscus CBS 115571]|uniref:non-specific serine/threonine protein kinase n=1 Tax=Aspergillus violaceofuscus (strain CBS 115571) TaxID=1450538 RepID=A0A2V5HIQ1_ASPV1|nr:hypothetical protein BO99DRAFT_91760 [Aspergillus violaceofuscus CBS 115571]
MSARTFHRPSTPDDPIHNYTIFSPLESDPNEPTASSSPPSPSPTPRPSKPQYRLIEDVEDLHRYRPGGYPFLQVGDHLAEDRYQLVHKLGSGGYSTIWLARDLREARYVAVKTITADASRHSPEARVLRSLGSSVSRPGKEVFPPLLDEFWVAGRNGRHRCVVTPPARMSVFDTKELRRSSIHGAYGPSRRAAVAAPGLPTLCPGRENSGLPVFARMLTRWRIETRSGESRALSYGPFGVATTYPRGVQARGAICGRFTFVVHFSS